ncbi:MAG: glutathione S-transferase family protein [Gammaproteobacteria bacterium]
MTDQLIFYTNPMSRGRIVRWMLEEVGAPYQTEVLDYGTTMKSDAYRKINPMGKVPAIVHGGRVVTEAAAICAYLADAFPEAGLAPPPAARDRYYRWLFYFSGTVEAAVINRTLGFEVPLERERMVGYGNYANVMDTVEQAVQSSPYIAGDQFSAADVYCGSQLGWGMEFGSIEARPAFEAYWRRLSDRAARQRANAIDDALVPK